MSHEKLHQAKATLMGLGYIVVHLYLRSSSQFLLCHAILHKYADNGNSLAQPLAYWPGLPQLCR